jgi:hypothetical protein
VVLARIEGIDALTAMDVVRAQFSTRHGSEREHHVMACACSFERRTPSFEQRRVEDPRALDMRQ